MFLSAQLIYLCPKFTVKADLLYLYTALQIYAYTFNFCHIWSDYKHEVQYIYVSDKHKVVWNCEVVGKQNLFTPL